MVSNEPFLPYRGVAIIKDLIDNQVVRSRAFKRYPKAREECLNAHLKPELSQEEKHDALNVINNLCHELESEVYDFLANHSWSMFFTKIQNTKLTIERGLDYRVYCWICEHEEEWRNGKYQSPG